MKLFFLSLTTILYALSAEAQQVRTVEKIDLEQYVGFWNTLATAEAPFQKDCVRNMSAEYIPLESGEVDVINRCEEEDGTVQEIDGRARIASKYNDPARLEVSFISILGRWIWLIKGKYWVIGLKDDYSMAIVGEPSQKFVWVLSRDTEFTPTEVRWVETILTENGYDSCEVFMLGTDLVSYPAKTPLCSLVD